MVQQAVLDRVFAALSDPTRRGVLVRLGDGPATVGELAEPTGMTLTGMKKHVQVLEDAGLVVTEKVGRTRQCRLSTAPLDDAMAWISFYQRLWARRLDGLDAYFTMRTEPEGWHLPECHLRIGGRAVSASLFDFGLYLFHCGQRQIDRGSGPYFYLPKMESHLEARLWNDVFVYAQEYLGIPRGTIRATVLIETINAAFEMEEILYELREHSAGLNAGRWDYLFSMIKNRPDVVLPERSQVTMTAPFMRAYTELLVRTCHKRGAHAIGGMAAVVPSRDPVAAKRALNQVRQDKRREVGDGFDGSWVAHPGLVETCREVFDQWLGDEPHQIVRKRDDVRVTAAELLDIRAGDVIVTEVALRTNVSVALRYIAAWLGGRGAVALGGLMEDAATAEICRAQLWQWISSGTPTDYGVPVTAGLVARMLREELDVLSETGALDEEAARCFGQARTLLTVLLSERTCPEFLTLPAYLRHLS
ncbi:metalloregulator ArsR/SmtB family transcription factor, partial [Actinoplanes philippinensis]|uniref:metalloregulator ArsR/SmtB family transcription factor n=1 Tax=Actinoplanes philippinensis TaxID=35752 RepID=UPI0033EE95BE